MPMISSSPSSTGFLHQVLQLLEKKVGNISPILHMNSLVANEGARDADLVKLSDVRLFKSEEKLRKVLSM